MTVWELVERLRREGTRSRLGRDLGREEEPPPPIGGWPPVLDDDGVAHGEPPPTEPTDAPF